MDSSFGILPCPFTIQQIFNDIIISICTLLRKLIIKFSYFLKGKKVHMNVLKKLLKRYLLHKSLIRILGQTFRCSSQSRALQKRLLLKLTFSDMFGNVELDRVGNNDDRHMKCLSMIISTRMYRKRFLPEFFYLHREI